MHAEDVQALQATNAWHWWWRYARVSAARFAAGLEPAGVDVHGPILEEDEEAILEADVTTSRLYGGDGHYNRSDLVVLGRPAVMVGVLVANEACNHRRKVAARRRAEVRWRDDQRVHLWATTRRLIVDGRLGIESYWYSAVNGFYPDLPQWSLSLAFGDGSAPLRIVGPPVPALCLWAATAVLGERWEHDPRLASLLL
ncbi:hypothetical protein [Mycolicibacterium septicum]|uniref:hypothetical protein n=1 Tax=Mycolicibacterium septicum TaxID=98668 RepID=UPI00236098D9|nr:hypothetical protein [Mycolicibacterium septicum]